MAISTKDIVDKFGTQVQVDDTTTSAVADGSFSVAADTSTWTNVDDAPMANFAFTGTFSVAPDDGATVELYARPMNVRSTLDNVAPGSGATAGNRHTYLGAFPIDNVTTQQTVTLDAGLPNTKSQQEYEFYIRNNAGQSLSASWLLYLTPKTVGPHA